MRKHDSFVLSGFGPGNLAGNLFRLRSIDQWIPHPAGGDIFISSILTIGGLPFFKNPPSLEQERFYEKFDVRIIRREFLAFSCLGFTIRNIGTLIGAGLVREDLRSPSASPPATICKQSLLDEPSRGNEELYFLFITELPGPFRTRTDAEEACANRGA